MDCLIGLGWNVLPFQVMCPKMPSELFQTAFLPTRFSCRVGLPFHPKASDKQGGF